MDVDLFCLLSLLLHVPPDTVNHTTAILKLLCQDHVRTQSEAVFAVYIPESSTARADRTPIGAQHPK
jgi:hypothetical protein